MQCMAAVLGGKVSLQLNLSNYLTKVPSRIIRGASGGIRRQQCVSYYLSTVCKDLRLFTQML